MDTISKEHRSWNMSRIKGKNTTPELRVRSVLHRMGYRFRLHKPELPGKPDIVLPKFNQIIFIHGCYWHRHEGCKLAYTPKSRKEFWQDKFDKNIERDKQVFNDLKVLGWKVDVIWECGTKSLILLESGINEIFTGKSVSARDISLSDAIKEPMSGGEHCAT